MLCLSKWRTRAVASTLIYFVKPLKLQHTFSVFTIELECRKPFRQSSLKWLSSKLDSCQTLTGHHFELDLWFAALPFFWNYLSIKVSLDRSLDTNYRGSPEICHSKDGGKICCLQNSVFRTRNQNNWVLFYKIKRLKLSIILSPQLIWLYLYTVSDLT